MPRDAVSRTAHVGTVGKNGLRVSYLMAIWNRGFKGVFSINLVPVTHGKISSESCLIKLNSDCYCTFLFGAKPIRKSAITIRIWLDLTTFRLALSFRLKRSQSGMRGRFPVSLELFGNPRRMTFVGCLYICISYIFVHMVSIILYLVYLLLDVLH